MTKKIFHKSGFCFITSLDGRESRSTEDSCGGCSTEAQAHTYARVHLDCSLTLEEWLALPDHDRMEWELGSAGFPTE